MSLKSAKAYIERMRSDAKFRESLNKAKSKEEKDKVLKAAGYDFTKEEVDKAASELGLKDLDKVAGGVGNWDVIE